MTSITIYWNTGIKCTSGWTAPPYWASNTSYTVEWGEGVKPTTANGHNYILSRAGTSGSSDPFSSSDKNWDEILDGDATTGAKWTCFDEFTNPTVITSKPFGHGFQGSLYYLRYACGDPADVSDDIDSTYLSGHVYNANSLSSQHEIASIRYRIFSEDGLTEGHVYRVKEIWKKAGGEIFRREFDLTWGNWIWYQPNAYIGWSPCWWWPFGSLYNGYEEITENGSDYLARIELYDGSSLICASNDTDNAFTIENLQHTGITWYHIQDYTGADIGGYFGMKASEYVHDLGDDIWDTQWYRQKNLGYHDTLFVDGMEGTVNLYVYRSGYVITGRPCDGVTDKVDNSPYDFTDSYYLPASVQGDVKEGSDPILIANVWGERSGAKYGCYAYSDGKFALPLHTGGTYTIKAAKNNYDVATSGTTVTQSGKHPSSSTSINFGLSRTTNYPQGEYAHLNSFAVDGQSVIIPDDPVTTEAGTPNQPDSVGATVVKVKTHKWGDGTAQCTTSTGTSNGGSAYGSGGFDYNGDMGEAESWSEEPPP